MPRKNELDGKAVQAYGKSYRLTRSSINESIAKLTNRNLSLTDNISTKEKTKNKDEITKLKIKKSLLDAKKGAFDVDQHTITPPSSEQLESLKKIIEKVEQLNTNQEIFNEIVLLSTDALTEFNKIHPDQPLSSV